MSTDLTKSNDNTNNNNKFKIIAGDAVIVLHTVKAESIDMVFTSPTPPANYGELFMLEQTLLQLPRTLKQTGSIWIQMPDYHNSAGQMAIIPERFLFDMVIEHEWQLRGKLIWHRPVNKAPELKQNERLRFRRDWEYLFWFVKDIDHYYYLPTDKNDLLWSTSIINEEYHKPSDNSFESGLPLNVIDLAIVATCPPNGRILDPFAGTGTTGVAALNRYMEFLGIEIQDSLIAKIKERLSSITN